jgi:hypothetical protein
MKEAVMLMNIAKTTERRTSRREGEGGERGSY